MSGSVNPVNSQGAHPAATTNLSPGKAEFLTLLAAQLRYQSPLEPMTEKDMVAQLASFSMLDELTQIRHAQEWLWQDLGAGLVTMAAVSILGKRVSAVIATEEGPEVVTGIVDSTRWSLGGAEVRVNGTWIPWEKLTGASIDGSEGQ